MRRGTGTFWVQETPKTRWHVESADDCETMLCGRRIPVDSTAKVRHEPPPRALGCPDCWMRVQR